MPKLERSLSLFDAVNIALGSIIGAGIFVIIGTAAGMAGPAVFISVIIAGAVAAMTGISSSALSGKYPKSGCAYLFAREAISRDAGFIVGWIWLFSNILTGATVAVGFAQYLAYFLPGIWIPAASAGAVALATAISLAGAKASSRVNNVLVALKIAILLFFIAIAASSFKSANFEPISPFGLGGIMAGAATIFFAYSGFARVAVIADEIKEPEKNVPKATLISIGVSTAIYIAVAIAAVGAAGYIAISSSTFPLATAMESVGSSSGALILSAGALIATGTVLLASILGVSRLSFTMAENRELPGVLGRVGANNAPRIAIAASGAVMLALAAGFDLTGLAIVSSFSVLAYYVAINASAILLIKGWTRLAGAAGLLTCIALMASLPVMAWAAGALLVLSGIFFRILRH